MAQANPFDDPATQKAVAKAAAPYAAKAMQDPNVQQAVFKAAMGSYGNDNNNSYGRPAPDKNNADLDPNAWDGEVPEEKSIVNDAHATGSKCSARMPLRIFSILVGVAYLVCGSVGFLGSNLERTPEEIIAQVPDKVFLRLFVNMFCLLGGIICLIVEFPAWKFNGWLQSCVFYWALFMSRLWGRSWSYFFLAILAISAGGALRVWIGVFVILVCIVMYFVGYTSSRKLNRISVYVAAGCEKDKRKEKVLAKFHELDVEMKGFLTKDQMIYLGSQADREISQAEIGIIMRFFDPYNHEEVSLDAWTLGFAELEDPGVSSL